MWSDKSYRPSSLSSIYHIFQSNTPDAPIRPVVKAPVQVEAPRVPAPVAEVVKKKAPAPVPEAVVKKRAVAPPSVVATPEPKPEPKPKPAPKPKAEAVVHVTPIVEEEPAPRLRVIHRLLSKPNPEDAVPKPKRVTAMSELWKQANAKGITGYNRMKKVDLEKALSSK